MKLILRDIRKEYNGVCILNGISYSFETGKIYGVIGRPGSGKTTLLRCIAREYDFTGTDTLIDAGKRIFGTDSYDYMLLDKDIVMPKMLTGRQYIEQCLNIHEGRLLTETIDEYVEMFGFGAENLDMYMKEYTGEELQIIQLVAVSIIRPLVVLMDELVSNFMIPSIFFESLEHSVVIIAESNEEEAKNYCDEILYLEKGACISNRI